MGLQKFSLDGKHIAIIGASSGLGKASAIACANCGAIISIAARREEELKKVIDALPGSKHGYSSMDVTDVESINKGFDYFVKERGLIDGMVFAAGTSVLRPVSVLSERVYDQVMNTNLKGAFFCAKAVLKNSRTVRERASLVFMSSINSFDTIGRGMTLYSASKAGINGMVRALALDISPQNHRANVLTIGAIETDIWKSNPSSDQTKRILDMCLLGPGDVDDVAYACVFLLSHASRWITGANLLIDGGITLTE